MTMFMYDERQSEAKFKKNYVGPPLEKIDYFNSGRVAQRYYEVNGWLHGMFTSYYSSGGIFEEVPYVHDQIIGIEREYYRDGSIKSIRPVHDDMFHGKEERYSENGEVWLTGHYHLGVEIGEWRHRQTDGWKVTFYDDKHQDVTHKVAELVEDITDIGHNDKLLISLKLGITKFVS